MNTYYVELTWPRTARKPVYGSFVQARTQAEAKLLVIGRAHKDGFKGTPLKAVAWIDNGPAAA